MAQHLTIAFDRNSDLFLDGQGNLAMATGRYALSYITLNAIRTVRGELVYNTEAGVPYFTTVFENPPNLRLWEYYVRETALAVDGVISVDSFLCEIKNNAVSYEMVMSTEWGGVPIGNRGNMLILDETDPALPETEEITPDSIPITITARNLWVDTFTGNTIFSQTLNPTPGTPLYNVTSIQDYLRDGETYTEAQMRLAGSTVADVIVFQYIRVNNDYYWRNEAADAGITFTPVLVRTQEFPRGLQPTSDLMLWRESSYATIIPGAPTGRLFVSASPTDTPDDPKNYLASDLIVSSNTLWEKQVLVIGNYQPNGDYGEQPYLVATGQHVTVNLRVDVETVEPVTFYEMTAFAGSTYGVTAWVLQSFLDNPGSASYYAPTETPEVNEEGELINENFVTVHGSQGWSTTFYTVNGLWYREGGSGSSYGYVFDIADSAQAWSVSPAVGNDTVYTSFTGGTADLSVCYENSDLTGGTASVTATGYAAYAIITLRGETFYNTMKFNEE